MINAIHRNNIFNKRGIHRNIERRILWHEQDRVWFKVTDFYYWDAEYYPPGADEPVIIHDLDALPALSKFFGRRIANCHVSDRGIWFECEPKLPRKNRK